MNAFAIPASEECPKEGFVVGIDKSNMQNKLCIRDQRVTQETSNDQCFSLGPRTEDADDKAYELQNVRCKSDQISYEVTARCKKGTTFGQCISDQVTSAGAQKKTVQTGTK